MAVPNQPGRRFHFSLRSLLALVVVVAIPLAWVAKERRQSGYERGVAARFRVETGGSTITPSRAAALLPSLAFLPDGGGLIARRVVGAPWSANAIERFA